MSDISEADACRLQDGIAPQGVKIDRISRIIVSGVNNSLSSLLLIVNNNTNINENIHRRVNGHVVRSLLPVYGLLIELLALRVIYVFFWLRCFFLLFN